MLLISRIGLISIRYKLNFFSSGVGYRIPQLIAECPTTGKTASRSLSLSLSFFRGPIATRNIMSEAQKDAAQASAKVSSDEAASKIEKLSLKDDDKSACCIKPKNSPKEPEETSLKSDTAVTKVSAVKPQKPPRQAPAAPEKPIDVSRLDLRIGKIVEVSRHPDADSLYVEKIDCGDTTGPRTVISGLVKHVPIEEMLDRYVVVLCNLKPAKMRGVTSEAMVMCASTEEKVELIKPPADVKPGDRVVFDQYPGEPDAQLNPKKKIWEQIAPDVKTNEEGVATYKGCEFRISGNDGKFTSTLKGVQVR